MKSAVLVFPGINRERDMARALKLASGNETAMVWHAETSLPKGTDLVVVPEQASVGRDRKAGNLMQPIRQAPLQIPFCGEQRSRWRCLLCLAACR